MIVLISNHSGKVAKELAKSGKLGNLYSPNAQQKPISDYWALDNGRYICWDKGIEWNIDQYIKLLEWATKQKVKPKWALVPDIVGNKEETLKEWNKYYPLIKSYGFTPAFAVQDGMIPNDVPKDAEVIFVGGLTSWKWKNLHIWTTHFDRVHVGKVNAWKQMNYCLELGVESVDGTGWFRGCKRQLKTLTDYCNNIPLSLFE